MRLETAKPISTPVTSTWGFYNCGIKILSKQLFSILIN